MTSRRSLGDEVTDRLRDAIVTGQLAAGDRLVIRDLAARLGVSPMPIREALVALAGEGLVEGRTNRGFTVVRIAEGDLHEFFRVHAFVAGLLAERAATEAGHELVDELVDLEAEIEAAQHAVPEAGRAAAVEELNHRFHRAINRSVDAPRLRWLAKVTGRYVPRAFYRQVPGWVEQTVSDHPAIVDALSRGDGVQARALMEAHVLAAGGLVVAARHAESPAGAGPEPELG